MARRGVLLAPVREAVTVVAQRDEVRVVMAAAVSYAESMVHAEVLRRSAAGHA